MCGLAAAREFRSRYVYAGYILTQGQETCLCAPVSDPELLVLGVEIMFSYCVHAMSDPEYDDGRFRMLFHTNCFVYRAVIEIFAQGHVYPSLLIEQW